MTNPKWQRWKGIMKAYPFEEKRLAKWSPPYIVQPKYDGVRCRAIRLENGEYILLSSEENIIYSVPHINIALGRHFKTPELDGELYTHGMSFEDIVSITSRTKNLHSYHYKIQFHIFDIVSEKPQYERTVEVTNLCKTHPSIVLAPYYVCMSLDEVIQSYNEILGDGYEGIIVRHCSAPYVRKRSTYVMKFKPKKEDSYEIVGFTEEIDKDGEPKDTLGALVCKSGDGHLFNVGTGFTDQRRQELWNGRDMVRGCSAKVKYQHITSGKQVPRFPVFVEIEVKP